MISEQTAKQLPSRSDNLCNTPANTQRKGRSAMATVLYVGPLRASRRVFVDGLEIRLRREDIVHHYCKKKTNIEPQGVRATRR